MTKKNVHTEELKVYRKTTIDPILNSLDIIVS